MHLTARELRVLKTFAATAHGQLEPRDLSRDVYLLLPRLVRLGFLVKPRTNSGFDYYQLTAEGRRAVERINEDASE
jgi:hypothetical protein